MPITDIAVIPAMDIETSVQVDGTFEPSDGTVTNAKLVTSPEITRSKCEQVELAVFGLPLTQWRTYDDMNTVPTSAAGDDLHITGTFSSESAHLTAGDIAATSSTRYMRTEVVLPPEYDAGETVKIRVWAGMQTTPADDSCTVDLHCERNTRDGTSGASDICATNAQSINTTSFTSYDFDITATGLVAGDRLDVQLAIAYTDLASDVVVEPTITATELLCDIKG